MYRMQICRDRPISDISIFTALFWQHRHMADPSIVSTPWVTRGAEQSCGLFLDDTVLFEEGFDHIRSTRCDTSTLLVHQFFGNIREREFVLWPVPTSMNSSTGVNSNWVTIILHLRPSKGARTDSGEYTDRVVTEYTIVDPSREGRDARKKFVEARLAQVLREGSIGFCPSKFRPFHTPDVEETWATGHVAYAICREVLRRLKTLVYRRMRQKGGGEVSTDFVFADFEEHYDVDEYRQSMMSSCANHTIEKSGYIVRVGLDVPGPKSRHIPDNLKNHAQGYNTMSDEVFLDSNSKDLVLIKIGEPEPVVEQSPESDVDESDIDQPDPEETPQEESAKRNDDQRPEQVNEVDEVDEVNEIAKAQVVTDEDVEPMDLDDQRDTEDLFQEDQPDQGPTPETQAEEPEDSGLIQSMYENNPPSRTIDIPALKVLNSFIQVSEDGEASAIDDDEIIPETPGISPPGDVEEKDYTQTKRPLFDAEDPESKRVKVDDVE